MYALVQDGKVTKIGLPKSGVLSDGRTVSNYDKLTKTALAKEGWLPLEESSPVCKETETLKFVDYTVTKDKVTANYQAVLTPDPIPTLEERVTVLESKLAVK
jgi:hypothetical protein